MDKRILAICDIEENYAYRMMEVLKLKKEIPFEICVFTAVPNLLRFSQKEAVECLMITETAYVEEIKKLAIPHVFILNESGVMVEENLFYNINKYQSADCIVNEMLSYYTEKSPDISTGKTKASGFGAKIIGIYTPIRRCLQTTFTMTLGQILARNHRTLYLNYECYSGFSRMMGREFHSDITDLVYFYECVREKFVYKLSTITEQINGMDFIPPVTVYPDMMNIPGRQWTELLRELRTESGYDYILLDLSDYVNGLFEILQECNLIYTITRGDLMALSKLEEYEKILGIRNCQQVSSRTKKLNFPVFKNIPLKFNELTYGELASYIKENLLEELYGAKDT